MNLDGLKALWSVGTGWLIAGLVAVLLVYEGGKKWLPAVLEWLVKRVGAALAGTKVMRRFALRAYREQIAHSSSRLPVVFSKDIDLDVSTVYVPLQAVGANAVEDAYGQIRETDHVVVLGPPGAGKSMLLRHSMLTWAQGADRGRVPVLVELHRCNGNTTALVQLVVEQFERESFPKAARFVDRALRSGSLSVLFDGLDEVNAAERDRVAQLIKDFATRHHACQIVVTCRTAIYDQHLTPEISVAFHVLEFDEKLIRRFLRQWPGFDDTEVLDRLLAALRDNPRIMQLARNPLLLTMIAYLYSSGQTLPDSRAEFYQDATQELLSKLKNTANRYPGPAKKAILRRLALVAQDVPAFVADRRTLGYEQVLVEMGALLPNLNIATSEAVAVLREIVDRSGLLLAVDGGERYQFAHLSLQEFLVASALQDDPEGLLERYRRAPGDWRETVKLWCGTVSRDCGAIVEAVFALDPVLAFECLADAQVLDEALADRITSHFLDRLATADRELVNAFGSVAAVPRERGRRTYDFLVASANDHDHATRQAARRALAATKLPQAAAALYAIDALDEMKSMGDLAVPALTRSAKGGHEAVVDILHAIGTPAAAQALAELIWEDSDIATRAAWCLAVLIADPEVESALADVSPELGARRLDWVWEPFEDPNSPVVTWVAGRVAHLLDQSSVLMLPDKGQVDPRLAIPLCVFSVGSALRDSDDALPESIKAWMESHRRPESSTSAVENTVQVDDLLVKWFYRESRKPIHAGLFRSIEPKVRLDMVARLLDKDVPVRIKDWADVRGRDDPYVLFRSRSHIAATVLYGVFCLVAVFLGVRETLAGWDYGPTAVGWIFSAYVVLANGAMMTINLYDEEGMGLVSYVQPWNIFGEEMRSEIGSESTGTSAILLLLLPWFVTTVLLALLVGVPLYGWIVVLTVIAVVATAITGLLLHGARRERAALNPLRGLLELGEVAARNRTSVIAG